MGTRFARVRALVRRRSVRLGLVALVLVGAGVAYYVRHERATARHRQLADAALDRLEFSTAATHLRAYLTARPGDAEAQLLLARTLRRDGRFADAERQLEEARRAGAGESAVRQEAFLIGLQKGGIAHRSTDELSATVSGRDPDRAVLEALYRGDLALRNWDRAGLWLHVWLEHHPDDWPPRLWQAELLERFEKYDRARADYLRVLELRPDQPRALLGVGLCALANRADYQEAEEYLGRYVAVDPDNASAGVGLARCRYGQGDLAGARERAGEVLARHPNHPGAALLLGTVEAEAGRFAEARRWLRVAEAGGADPVTVNYQLAQVLRGLGEPAEADAALRRFTQAREGRRAAESATRAAEREPGNAESQYRAGLAYLALGEPDLAARWFADAVRADPGHRAAHAALADYFAARTDTGSGARAQFHRAKAEK